LVIVGRFLVGRLIGGIVRRLIRGIVRRLIGGLIGGVIGGIVGGLVRGLVGRSLRGRRGRRLLRAGGDHDDDRRPALDLLVRPGLGADDLVLLDRVGGLALRLDPEAFLTEDAAGILQGAA